MSSDPQLALFSCVDDVLLRTLYQLIRLFIVEFCEVQIEQEAVVGYFARPYSHLPGVLRKITKVVIQVITVPAGVQTEIRNLTARADLLGGGLDRP
jgi:hypothetical protein